MKKPVLFLTALFACLGVWGQNLSDLIISEAMPGSPASVADDYGNHPDWIEIFNTSQGTVSFGGCFLTDDRTNLTKCQITKDDRSTKIGPRQVALLYAAGNSALGTYYLNFTLPSGGTVYLVSNDGRTIIDSLAIPAALPEGMSISKFAHDNKEMVFDDIHPAVPSPLSLNGRHEQKSRAQKMKETDPKGWSLSLVAVAVVFSALLILFLIYNLSGNIFTGKVRLKRKKRSKVPEGPEAAAIALALKNYTSGEEDIPAAIALALHLYCGSGVHDTEPGFITIKVNNSSAWADKSLNFRKQTHKI